MNKKFYVSANSTSVRTNELDCVQRSTILPVIFRPAFSPPQAIP